MNEFDEIADISKSDKTLYYSDMVKTLEEMTAVQCSDGNWDYDEYMHGMANGMIFALSLFQDKRPEYLDAPKKWVKDTPNTDKPICKFAGA